MRKSKWDKVLTEEFLNEQYTNLKKSMKIIADEVGCSISTIRKYLKKHNIKIRTIFEALLGMKTIISKKLTKKYLIQEYIINKKTTKSIADEVGCDRMTISRYLKKQKIHIRTKSENQTGKKRKPFSEEWRRNLSEANKGISRGKGKKLTKEHKLKIKNNHKGMEGLKCSDKTKQKISKGNKGKKRSLETRKKQSLAKGGAGVISENLKYGPGFDSILKEAVRSRDNYICQECGCTQLQNHYQLSIHHIDYNKKNNKITNLISLCNSCHPKTNTKNKREYWIKHFQEKIKIKIRSI